MNAILMFKRNLTKLLVEVTKESADTLSLADDIYIEEGSLCFVVLYLRRF